LCGIKPPRRSTETLHLKLALDEHISRIHRKPNISALAARRESNIIVIEERVKERLALLITGAVRRERMALSNRERIRLGVLVADAGGEDFESSADVDGRGGGECFGFGGRIHGRHAVGGAWAGVEHAFLAHCFTGVVDVVAVVAVLALGGFDGGLNLRLAGQRAEVTVGLALLRVVDPLLVLRESDGLSDEAVGSRGTVAAPQLRGRRALIGIIIDGGVSDDVPVFIR
jgi:hypothetical protein